jgi:hypothetical protein
MVSARLAAPRPAAGVIPPGRGVLFTPCDATASGSEDAQVRMARGAAVLDLCGHHAGEYGLALLAAGWRVIIDNRSHLR